MLRFDIRIRAERNRIVTCSNAIFNLEVTIPNAKSALKAYMDTLSRLRETINCFQRLQMDSGQELHDERTSQIFYKKTLGFINRTISKSTPVIQEQIGFMDEEIRIMRSHLHQLESELDGWRFSKKLAEAALKNFVNCKDNINSMLKSARDAFSAIRRVPENVWCTVFRLRVEEDVARYPTRKNSGYFMPTVLSLSRVCRQWRSIIEWERDLWRHLPAFAKLNWPAEKCNLLRYMLGRSGFDPTLLVNLDYNTSQWAYRNGLQAVKQDPTLQPASYSLSIILTSNQTGAYTYTRAGEIPLRSPISLTIHSQQRNPAVYELELLRHFPDIRKLSLNDTQRFGQDHIGSIMKKLSFFSLRLKRFTSFDLRPHLPGSLEELYINHPGINRFTMGDGLQLQRLSTLALTPYEIQLFKGVVMNALHTFILYSPESHPTVQLTECMADISNVFAKIKNLELHHWVEHGASQSTAISWNSVSLFRCISEVATSLVEVKFVQCLVDGVTLKQALFDRSWSGRTKLITITLDQCSGLTQQECEALNIWRLVSGLNVYV